MTNYNKVYYGGRSDVLETYSSLSPERQVTRETCDRYDSPKYLDYQGQGQRPADVNVPMTTIDIGRSLAQKTKPDDKIDVHFTQGVIDNNGSSNVTEQTTQNSILAVGSSDTVASINSEAVIPNKEVLKKVTANNK